MYQFRQSGVKWCVIKAKGKEVLILVLYNPVAGTEAAVGFVSLMEKLLNACGCMGLDSC
jgi:hypothetical protein